MGNNTAPERTHPAENNQVIYRRYGAAANTAFFNRWLKADELFQSFPITNIGLPPFVGSFSTLEVPRMIMAGLGKCLTLGRVQVRHDAIFAYTMVELLGRFLPNKVPAQQRSRKLLVTYINALLTYNRLAACTSATRETYVAQAAMTDDQYSQDATRRLALKPQATDWVQGQNIQSPEAAIRILYHLSRHAIGQFIQDGMGVIANCAVALAKRRTFSINFADIIQNKVNEALGANITISVTSVKMFYDVISQFMQDNKVQGLFEYWLGLVVEHALRLCLTLTQAAASGLTAFLTIGRALRRYRDFEWNKIYVMFPDDFRNFELAVQADQGDLYYEFRRELGPVRSTKFKYLAYVAKELLIRVGGDAPSARHQGWTNALPFKARVDELVLQYRDAHSANITPAIIQAQTEHMMEIFPQVDQNNNVAALFDYDDTTINV